MEETSSYTTSAAPLAATSFVLAAPVSCDSTVDGVPEERRLCTKHGTYHPISSFAIKRNGERQKTCISSKQKRKRAIKPIAPTPVVELSTWAGFREEIEQWEPTDQNLFATDVCLSFDDPELPVKLDISNDLNQTKNSDDNDLIIVGGGDDVDGEDAEKPEIEKSSTPALIYKRDISRRITGLAKHIWDYGGYRFFLKNAYPTKPGFTLQFYCCQDSAYDRTKPDAKCDEPSMARFVCRSKLEFLLSMTDRTIQIKLQHKHHDIYRDVQLSPQVMNFVDERLKDSAGSIYRELQIQEPAVPGARDATQKQIFYRWRQANKSDWCRHKDQYESTRLLLEEQATKFYWKEYTSGNMRSFAVFCTKTMATLASTTHELAMDSTYGTNSESMDLFAVLAEYDGTGVVLAYLFVQVLADEKGVKRADVGATTRILIMFLEEIRSAGFHPTFFGSDKDRSEISAIQSAFPETTVQLCNWHARRAVKTKLNQDTESNPISRYLPADVLSTVPEAEICWASAPHRRPDGPHRYLACHCTSPTNNLGDKGRLEASSKGDKKLLLDLFDRHFYAHPLLPHKHGVYRDSTTIYQECVRELYNLCKSRGWCRVWVYFYLNWYRPDQWRLWARASHSTRIPILQTTMIVEAHWRRVKHDYLHRFNRPRVDLVAWILTKEVFPMATIQMGNLVDKNDRVAKANWRHAFKKEWKMLDIGSVTLASLQQYHTDPRRWVCTCDAFLFDRFFLCKHLVFCLNPMGSVKDRILFFSRVQRQRAWPFVSHKLMVIKPGFDSLQGHDASLVVPDSVESSELSGNAIVWDVESEEEKKRKRPKTRHALEIFRTMSAYVEDQEQKGNFKFVDRVSAMASSSFDRLIDDIEAKKRQRSMPLTFDAKRHPAAMYYQG